MSAPSDRVVRIFVSTTFADLAAERKVLETIVFPELRRRCAARGVELIKIDPRFNVAAEAVGEAELAERFRLIESCRPFFLGLLGECYGPVVTPPEALVARYPWLADCRDRSVTEWEILHGALNDPAAARRSFFWFRDPRFVAELPPAVRARFQPESASAAGKLAALKFRLRASGLPMRENYPCRWDPVAEQPAGLEDFARQVIDDLWAAIEAEEVTPKSRPPTPPSKHAPLENAFSLVLPESLERAWQSSETRQEFSQPYLDRNVQYTVYRPKTIEPLKWYPLLAFAHLDDLPANAAEDEPHPVEEVKRQAEAILGKKVHEYRESTEDSRLAVPREGEIVLVPQVPGLEFNPPRRTFLWQESVHREEFKLRAGPEMDGQTAKGALTVFLGSIILAEVGLSIRVQSGAAARKDEAPAQRSTARPYRKIFASYSHKDTAVVEQFERYGKALGDTYLRDWVQLRAGEVWSDRLLGMIGEADVFQLFWSTNAMRSEFVEREWRHALRLGRPNFVRPTYWEEPLPRWPERGLPPEELLRLHFERLPGEVLPTARQPSLPVSTVAPLEDVRPASIRPPSAGEESEEPTEEIDFDAEPSTKRGRADAGASRAESWPSPSDVESEEDEAPPASGAHPGPVADAGGSREQSSESRESDSEFELGFDDVDESSLARDYWKRAPVGEKNIFEEESDLIDVEGTGSQDVARDDAASGVRTGDLELEVSKREPVSCTDQVEAMPSLRPARLAGRRRIGRGWWAALLVVGLGLAVAMWSLFFRR